MVGEKSFQTIHENTTISSSCHSSARKKKRTKVNDTSLNQKVAQVMQYYGASKQS